MVRAQPTRQQLQHALEVSGCALDLDAAMQFPALATALRNAAAALASLTPVRDTRCAPGRHYRAPTVDMRSRAANDDTDKDL